MINFSIFFSKLSYSSLFIFYTIAFVCIGVTGIEPAYLRLKVGCNATLLHAVGEGDGTRTHISQIKSLLQSLFATPSYLPSPTTYMVCILARVLLCFLINFIWLVTLHDDHPLLFFLFGGAGGGIRTPVRWLQVIHNDHYMTPAWLAQQDSNLQPIG